MNLKRAALIPFATLAVLAVPSIADAHNASATPSCSGLSWQAVNYDKTVVNTIVVTVDGATVHQDLDFKSSDEGTSPWSQTAAHTWSVVINAPGTTFDRFFHGTWQACVAPTTTVEATTTTVADTTTTEPAPTTSVVDQCCVVVPTTAPPTTAAIDVVSLTPEPALPRTGGSTTILILGAILVASGGAVMLVRRRA